MSYNEFLNHDLYTAKTIIKSHYYLAELCCQKLNMLENDVLTSKL